MADESSQQKTEEPTAKKLRDARKRGEVAKTREIASTFALIGLAMLISFAAEQAARRIRALIDATMAALDQPFNTIVAELSMQASFTLLWSVGTFCGALALLAALADFVQVGPLLAPEKVKPDADHINPVEGFKRLFSISNLVELIKLILKAVVLLILTWLIIKRTLPLLYGMIWGTPAALVEAIEVTSLLLIKWTIAIFALVSLADWLFQKFEFLRKQRMSLEDVRRELKEDEGDPMLRGERRRLSHEWMRANANVAASNASVLVVNPVHVAVALVYDRKQTPVPQIAAMGEDALALEMRESARRAGVPQLQNITLARALLAQGAIGQSVPGDLFDAVAQAIVWAQKERDKARRKARVRR